jgi:predicted O-methyltransferase YrrM
MGFHITPNHFESPIPDTRYLDDALWSNNTELSGININPQAMVNLINLFSSKYKKEYDCFPKNKTSIPYQYYIKNRSFESVDAEIYYCMIRYFKPKRIFEIGSGYSTLIAAQAVMKNKEEFGNDTELIAIEPYPNETLKRGFSGLSELRTSILQDIKLSEFDTLCENDILFIDSSHILRIGSDVQYEYLELLPRLNKGVIIHVHDIFLPAEYKRDWIHNDHRFLNEQYLLQAFLAFNDAFEILWGGSLMHLTQTKELEKAFASYDKDSAWPGSFWLRKIR